MTVCKNKLFLAALLLSGIGSAGAQELTYLVPPVQLMPLKRMETNSYGLTFAEKDDVLNENIWKNAAYLPTAEKFSKLPEKLPAAAEDLRIKLLTMTADAPQGTMGQAFITLKLKELFARGRFDEVFRLIQKIPEKSRSDDQNRLYVEVLALKDLQTACYMADIDADGLFFQHLKLVCAAFNHDADKVYLTRNILREQNDEDAFLNKAVERFLRNKPLKDVPSKLTPLSVSVWVKAGGNLSKLKTENTPVWFDVLYAQDESVPVALRLPVIEQGVQNGLIAPAKLRSAYQQMHVAGKKKLSAIEKRAFLLQQAAALTGRTEDNLKKQEFLKQAMISAKNSGVAYAFAAAAKDILKSLRPDTDTLGDSTVLIEAFALAGLNEQAVDWQKKAEMVFPHSETTATGWPYAELAAIDNDGRFFIPHLETMMAFGEKSGAVNDAFIGRMDRLMLMFKSLGMIQPDESWHYGSFKAGSAESMMALRSKPHVIPAGKPLGDVVLEALRALDNGYTGLVHGLSVLTAAGLENEAAAIATQSVDAVMNDTLQ